MTFEDELRRVVDELAEHLRQEAAGRLQAAMPGLQGASESQQKAAIGRALERAREDAERDFNERIETVKREASEQVATAEREAADRVAASERQAGEQLDAARREHADRIETFQRESAELLSHKEREATERLDAKERETAERLEAKDREAADQLDARSREAAERLEAREREIAELLETKNRESAERLVAAEQQAMERAEAASREAAERLERAESSAAERLATAASEAEARAREAGRSEGLREGRDALAVSIALLANAQSLSEVLDALSDAAKREVPSVAIVLAQGDLVRMWRMTGFAQQPEQADAVSLALSEAGVIRAAIQAGKIVRGSSANADDVPGFATSLSEAQRAVAAFPLIVGGATVAVVYGDGPEADAATWQTSIEALASCASRSLETITAFRTAALLRGQGKGQREKGKGLTAESRELKASEVSGQRSGIK